MNESQLQPQEPQCRDVTIHLQYAHGLKNCKLVGQMDPFCIVCSGWRLFRSSVNIGGGSSPVWDQSFSFAHAPINDGDTVWIEVWSKGMFGDTKLGTATLSLSLIHTSGSTVQLLPVRSPKSKKQKGFLAVSVTFARTPNLPGPSCTSENSLRVQMKRNPTLLATAGEEPTSFVSPLIHDPQSSFAALGLRATVGSRSSCSPSRTLPPTLVKSHSVDRTLPPSLLKTSSAGRSHAGRISSQSVQDELERQRRSSNATGSSASTCAYPCLSDSADEDRESPSSCRTSASRSTRQNTMSTISSFGESSSGALASMLKKVQEEMAEEPGLDGDLANPRVTDVLFWLQAQVAGQGALAAGAGGLGNR